MNECNFMGLKEMEALLLKKCDELDLLKQQVDGLCTDQVVFSLPSQERGLLWESWTGDDAGKSFDESIVGFENSWSGPEEDGVPTHKNGEPTTSGGAIGSRFSPEDDGQDDHRLLLWVFNNSNFAIELRDSDERWDSIRVFAGCDCKSKLVHERYQIEGQPFTSRGPFMVLPPNCITRLTVLIHDPATDKSGFWLRANSVGSDEIFDPLSYKSRPMIKYEVKNTCNLTEQESLKPIELNCFDCASDGSIFSGISAESNSDITIKEADTFEPEKQNSDLAFLPETKIAVSDFKGTGLGKARIKKLSKEGITTVDQIAKLKEEEVDSLQGISTQNAKKILKRAKSIISKNKRN